MDIPKHLEKLTQYFGTEAIAFALGFDDPYIEDGLNEISVLNGNQNLVVSELRRKLSERRLAALEYDAPPQNDSFWVDQEFARGSEHMFVRTRRKLGGSLHKKSDSNDRSTLLINIAADVYPCFLIGQHRAKLDQFGFGTPLGLSVGIHSSSSTQAFLKNLSGSHVFTETESDNQLHWQTKSCLISNGHGYTAVSMAQLLVSFLYNAFLLTLMRGLSGFSNFCKSIEELTPTLSKFLEGEDFTIKAPTFIGLSGVELPEDYKDSSIGRMYNMPSTKAWLLNRNLVGQPCGAYLEIQSEVKVVFHENPLDKRELIEVHRGFADVYSNIRHIQRLVKSSLSTSATRRPVTCACSWEFSCFVLGTGNSGATPTSINVNNLNEDEFASWMKWIDLFYNDGPLFQRIEIGLERLSDSIYGFQTMQDGLINATIALENLFGITQGELTHRLSLAVARTLGDSLDSREYLYKQTQNLYKMRSKIVHGNTLNSKNILELRKLLAEAIDIYKRCLDQIVHHHRTDLMDNKIATIITLSD